MSFLSCLTLAPIQCPRPKLDEPVLTRSHEAPMNPFAQQDVLSASIPIPHPIPAPYATQAVQHDTKSSSKLGLAMSPGSPVCVFNHKLSFNSQISGSCPADSSSYHLQADSEYEYSPSYLRSRALAKSDSSLLGFEDLEMEQVSAACAVLSGWTAAEEQSEKANSKVMLASPSPFPTSGKSRRRASVAGFSLLDMIRHGAMRYYQTCQ